SRWWYRDIYGSDSMAMGFFPGVGLVLFGVGLYRVLPDSSIGLAFPFFVIGALVTMIGMVLPFLWGPRFYKDFRKRERARAKRKWTAPQCPFTTSRIDSMRRTGPGSVPAQFGELTALAFGGAPAAGFALGNRGLGHLRRWWGSLVDHRLGRPRGADALV